MAIQATIRHSVRAIAGSRCTPSALSAVVVLLLNSTFPDNQERQIDNTHNLEYISSAHVDEYGGTAPPCGWCLVVSSSSALRKSLPFLSSPRPHRVHTPSHSHTRRYPSCSTSTSTRFDPRYTHLCIECITPILSIVSLYPSIHRFIKMSSAEQGLIAHSTASTNNAAAATAAVVDHHDHHHHHHHDVNNSNDVTSHNNLHHPQQYLVDGEEEFQPPPPPRSPILSASQLYPMSTNLMKGTLRMSAVIIVSSFNHLVSLTYIVACIVWPAPTNSDDGYQLDDEAIDLEEDRCIRTSRVAWLER